MGHRICLPTLSNSEPCRSRLHVHGIGLQGWIDRLNLLASWRHTGRRHTRHLVVLAAEGVDVLVGRGASDQIVRHTHHFRGCVWLVGAPHCCWLLGPGGPLPCMPPCCSIIDGVLLQLPTARQVEDLWLPIGKASCPKRRTHYVRAATTRRGD